MRVWCVYARVPVLVRVTEFMYLCGQCTRCHAPDEQ
jgi:hypothetical protein